MQPIVTDNLKPWGSFIQFCKNRQCTVKLLTIKKDECLSLQSHKFRAELWYLLSGKGLVQENDKIREAYARCIFYIKAKTKHRYTAIEDSKILEVSFGKFNEKDIIRYEDKYKRT